MKKSLLLVSLLATIGLMACDRPATVVTPPATVVNTPPASSPPATITVPVPGPQGAPGAEGPKGEPGKGGDTVIVTPPATDKK